MPRPLNLFLLSRKFNPSLFNLVEAHLSQKDCLGTAQLHEINSLKEFVDSLINNNIGIYDLENFYYGYKIPQIGKEFDLLRISNDEIINIELKSRSIPKEQIKAQLAKNKYYLSHTLKHIRLFSVVTSPIICYEYTEDDFFEVDISVICNEIKKQTKVFNDDISILFDAAQFLVSPINQPHKFIHNNYFLTQQQDEYKKIIIQNANTHSHFYYHITGQPGTGKTLFLYDLAKSLSKHGETLIIHCGKLVSGHKELNNLTQGMTIISAKDIDDKNIFNQYKFILVDEAHRIYTEQFEKICDYVQSGDRLCIFSSDAEQVLSKLEKQRDISNKISSLSPVKCFTLSNKIRTSKEINQFIQSLFNLNIKADKKIYYSNIDVLFASTPEEANQIKNYYTNIGYCFINFTQSNYKDSPYSVYNGGNNTHHVIGQEFDNVIIILESSFYYDANNRLAAFEHPNPDYIYTKLLYQGLTRCRKKLALIIVNNHLLFQKINTVFQKD